MLEVYLVNVVYPPAMPYIDNALSYPSYDRQTPYDATPRPVYYPVPLGAFAWDYCEHAYMFCAYVQHILYYTLPVSMTVDG